MTFPEPKASDRSPAVEMNVHREQLLSSLRELAQAMQSPRLSQSGIAGGPQEATLPRIVADRRGRPVEVWDERGKQLCFFYQPGASTPYAYEVLDARRRPIERGSVTPASGVWTIHRNRQGLSFKLYPEDTLKHPVTCLEVSPDGVMLGNASDGYQFRRDTTGAEFEAFYGEDGTLREAVRHHEKGADHTLWLYNDDATTVARETRFDGTVTESKYDRWGRLMSRMEQLGERTICTRVTYGQDDTYKVFRDDQQGERVEEMRRKDGTICWSIAANDNTGEVVRREYDEGERLLKEEKQTENALEVTTWQYHDEGSMEALQVFGDGSSQETRYDSWGRVIGITESLSERTIETTFIHKSDGSYEVHRQTSDGLEAEEYYRADGTRRRSRAASPYGRIVEVDYDNYSRPIKRVTSRIYYYEWPS